MKKNNPRLHIVLLLIALILLLLLGALAYVEYVKAVYLGSLPELLFLPVTTTSEPIEITKTNSNPANQMQAYASMGLTVSDQKLFMYIPMDSPIGAGPYDGYLCSFENGSVQRIRFYWESVIGLWDGMVYYTTKDNSGISSLVCCQLNTGSDSVILESSERDLFVNANSCWIGPDGAWHYSIPGSDGYYRVQGTIPTEQAVICEQYGFGSKTYTFFRGKTQGKFMTSIISADADGNILRDYEGTFGNGTASVIPCDRGLVIHNAISPDMLYFIDGDSGEVIELFSVAAERTISTVNVHGGYVYLSFLRYKDYDQLWFGSFDNDTMEGTWRISLQDYSTEKLSDRVYTGLYIFDDTGIYACDDQRNLYKLDYDGNLIMTLLEH